MRYFFLCCLGLAQVAFAQKAKNYVTVTSDLADNVVTTTLPATPVRLAVVPFTATSASTQASTQFGSYLTETIIAKLGNHPDRVKLFERTRLDAILKEHEFILTDMMKPAAALKIGQLAPIDALLSGTYTKLKSYTDISARLMDVASGEILMSYTGRIKMDKNLAALFPAAGVVAGTPTQSDPSTVNITFQGNTTSPTKTKAELCKEKVQAFQPRLNDLSGKDKIDAVVNEATTTPFDNQCGQLHYYVMSAFTRYKIEHALYKNFLLQTLDTIAYPPGDDRAYEIVRFVSSDGQVDAGEWKVAFRALSRVGNYTLSTYLNYLLAKPAAEPQVSNARISEYFELATAGKLGLPRPVTYETAFFEMMEGVKSNGALGQAVYQGYSSKLQLDEKGQASLFSDLHALYKNETDRTRKTEIMEWIAAFVNAHEYPKGHEQLYDLAWAFNLTGNVSRNEEIRKEYPEGDLKVLVNRCGGRFAKYATVTPYPSQVEDRVNFCVRNNVAVPGIIPTLPEAKQILTGKDLDEQLRVMKLLVQMGDRPKPIESTVVALFEKRSLEERGKLDEIQTLAIVVLGNCRTPEAKGIAYMINALPHYGNDTQAAKIALVQIGKAAVQPLIARLDQATEQDGGLQYQLITLLGEIGPDAAPAEKSIRRVLSQTRNSDIRYAAEAALQAIGIK